MALNPEWLRLLKKVFIFSTFPEDRLNQLIKRMKLISFPKGATLFKKNDLGNTLYVIVSGTIHLMTDEADGTALLLDRGDALGEMSLLAGEPYNQTATVESTAELLVLTKKDFDQLLEKDPALAIHLSRVLSTRLASANRGMISTPKPAKIYSFIPAIPLRDQVIFAVNLALSLVEQTRRKTLLVVVGQTNDKVAKGMGLEIPPLHKLTANLEDFIITHPSGLDVLCLDEPSFFGPIGNALHSFFRTLKVNYDFCLIFVPPKITDITATLLNDSDRSFIISGPQSLSEDLNLIRKIVPLVKPNKKLEKIWLTVGQDTWPLDFPPDVRMHWDLEWGRHYMQSGVPFIPLEHTKGHCSMDRLARSLGNLVVGFAMGSGAAFGYSLIGMLRVLERAGIYPDVVSGTSMGALIGSFYAAGLTVDEIEAIAKSMTRSRLFRMIVADLTLPRSGLVAGREVLYFLKSHLHEKTFADLTLPFACVATDIQTGKEMVLDEGPVAEAVRASISLPFFFEPYYMQGRFLVDGGLVNPVPTSTTISLGANIVLSANLTSQTGERRVPKMGWRRQLPSMLRGPAIPEIMIKTIYTMQYEIAQTRSSLSDVIMHVSSGNYMWWDLNKAEDIIRLGEASAEESLPKIKSLLPFYANSCRVDLVPRGRKTY